MLPEMDDELLKSRGQIVTLDARLVDKLWLHMYFIAELFGQLI